MWPFSCLSVEGGLPSLPDFQDISAEEMRYEAYQSKAQGSMEPYIKKFQALAFEFQNKRKQLQNMTMDLKQKLIKLVEDGRRSKSSQSPASGFGFSTQPGASSSGLFGKTQSFSGATQSPAQPVPNLFGKPVAQGSLFGGGNSAVSSSSSPSVFSNNRFGVLASPAGSTFGGSSGSSSSGTLFGKPNNSVGGGVFGFGNQNNNQQTSLLGPAPTASPGLFGQSATQPGRGLFGSGSGAGSVFGTTSGTPHQPAPNLFGGSPTATPQPTAPSLFGTSGAATPQASLLGPIPASQPPSLFGKPASHTPALSQPQNQGTPHAPPNLFGKPSPGFGISPNQGGSSSGGLFGKGPSTQGLNSSRTTPGGNEVESPTLYTPLCDLTEWEKAAFEAKAFELGKIPLRPPPKELVRI